MVTTRKASCWLAVDIGGSSVKMALWDGRRLRHVERMDFGTVNNEGDWVSRLLQSKLQSWGNPSVCSVGVGVPALVSADHRTVLESANLGWRNYPLASVLRRGLHLPVYLDTDIIFAARAEATIGAGKQSDDFVYINLGTGVSHVRMLHQQPQLGAHGLGMNLGHAPLFSEHTHRPRQHCACGRSYCVECVLGGRTVSTALRGLGGSKRIRFWREYGESLGIALACMVSLIDPGQIVLNGGVCASRPFFESSMHSAYQRHTLHWGSLPRVCFSRLGDTAGLVGAGLTAQSMGRE